MAATDAERSPHAPLVRVCLAVCLYLVGAFIVSWLCVVWRPARLRKMDTATLFFQALRETPPVTTPPCPPCARTAPCQSRTREPAPPTRATRLHQDGCGEGTPLRAPCAPRRMSGHCRTSQAPAELPITNHAVASNVIDRLL